MCEIPECYGYENRKARKQHTCCECLGTIQPGERYHYHHGVWDGEAMSYKVCADCEALRADLDRDTPHDECTPFEGLVDSVMGSGNPELIARLMEIKRIRCATTPQWMADRLANARLLCEKHQQANEELTLCNGAKRNGGSVQ